INAAVKLSHRYLADRQLPDKAVSVLDTACARLALGQNTTPPAIEDAQREIDDCTVQLHVLEREGALGADHADRITAIGQQRAAAEEGRTGRQAGGEKEKGLFDKIRGVRAKIEEPVAPPPAQAPGAQAAAPVAQAAAAAPAAAPPAAPPAAPAAPPIDV